MTRRRTFIIGAAAVAALGAGGTAFAVGAGGDDDERPISGAALDRASAAALEHTGGGKVTETESGDEESYYEVEVTRPDGSRVDVQLDRDFNVVGDTRDREDDESSDDR